MGKFLLFLALVVIGVLLLKSGIRGSRSPASSDSTPPAKPADERMVQCARCGTFMPESESAQIEGRVSCRDPAHCAHRA